MMKSRTLVLLLSMIALLPAVPAAAQSQDVITVGTATSNGLVTDVPVYIRDVSGTPLGVDQPPGSRIQSFSIKVNYAPTAPIQSVTFTRAGITASLTPTFESSPAVAGSITLLATFDETTNPIPFTLNAAAPGNLVAHLVFTFVPGTAPGTVVTLTLDPTLTQLTDAGGSPATRENTAAGNLALVNGSVTAAALAVPALETWALLALAMALCAVAIGTRLRI
jgi:hypothetical protein